MPTLQPGAISLNTKTNVSIALVSTAPTGGVPNYSVQWHRSLTPGFTPDSTTLIAGATALSFVDAPLTPLTQYCYLVTYTDQENPGVTVTSAEFDVMTFADPTPITDPVLIQFCHERVRVFADCLRTMFYTAISFQTIVGSRPEILLGFPDGVDPVIDGLGRPMTAHDVNNMFNWANQVILLGAGTADMQSSIEKCALNGRSLF